MKVQSGIDARFTQIPCPVLRTLVKEERIQIGPEGQVDLEALKTALKGIGVNDLVSNILATGGADASSVPPQLLLGSGKKELDIYRLRGSSLDHKGDTQVLRDPAAPSGFSQDRLNALLAMSKDGKTLTLEDLAAANKRDMRAEDAGLRDVFIGMAELAALLLVFGKRNDDGVKGLRLDDVVSLYRDSKLPDDFKPGNVGLMDVVGAMAKMAFHRQFTVGGRAQAGLDAATDKPKMLTETAFQGIRQATCPAGMRPQASPAVSDRDIAQIHAQKAE